MSEIPTSVNAPSWLISVAPGVSILDPKIGPDSMAVFAAMMSRAPDLANRLQRTLLECAAQDGVTTWDFRTPPQRVRDFLEKNLAGHNHASIGSMAKAVWILLSDFGWPAAWLLEDTALFDGQEVSTRAVDAVKIAGVEGPGTRCLGAPELLEPIHAAWLQCYAAARDRAPAAKSVGGWRFDDARVLLPGSTPTAVVWTNDVRALARQLDHIAGLGPPFAFLAERGYQGLHAVAPCTTAAVGHKVRPPFAHWQPGLTHLADVGALRDVAHQVRLRWHDQATDPDAWAALMRDLPGRDRWGQHLDPAWAHAPRMAVRFRCTVAVARDWHRHRPPMPWRLNVCQAAGAGRPRLALAPWHRLAEVVPESLHIATTEAWETIATDQRLGGSAGWTALHALPFGAVVEVSCVAPLPALVYMLELRATTPGANPEYRAQAREGMRQLTALVPPRVAQYLAFDPEFVGARTPGTP